MIRSNEQGIPKRRIAVIQVPRPQRARMGSVGPAPPPAIAWTTISDEAPESSANWISYKLIEQATARQTTPGTLTYSPTANANNPTPNVAPWNSWLSPNCPPATGPAAATPDVTAPPDYSKIWLLIGGLTAMASLLYIANTAAGEDETRRRR